MKKKLTIAIIILVLLIICTILFFVLKPKTIKLNNNFNIIKESYKLDNKKKKINLKIQIKNISKKEKELNNLEIQIINKDSQSVFFYYTSINKTLKSKETYSLDISESILNSNLNSKKDIKKIQYKLAE